MKNILHLSRKFATGILASLTLLVSTSAVKAQSATEVNDEVKTEITRLNHELEKAIKTKDVATIVDLYSDDATIIVPGGKKIQGRKAIAEYWYGLTGTIKLTSEIIELGGNGKVVYEIGKWTVTTVKDGVEHTTATDVVIVWKRQQDYNYKIQLNSSNNPVAIASTPAPVYEAGK